MAAGLPVIVTTGIQIAPEIAAANAGIVIKRDTEFIGAITRLINSEALRSRLSKNAIELADKRYAWNEIASQLICSYKDIIGK